MENGVEALNMAFAMLIFVLAISITISCFGSAAQAMQSIWQTQQLEQAYVTDGSGNYLNYVSFNGGTRIVSADTIVPTMYRAYQESIIIYFYKSNGDIFPIDEKDGEEINYIDLQSNITSTSPAKYLDEILASTRIYSDGLYNELSKYKFTEKLGEYYLDDEEQTSDTAEVNKTKKRVVVYIQN